MTLLADPASMTRFRSPTPTEGKAPSHSPPDVHYAPGINLARDMGWFGLGLGLAELLAPRRMAELSGVPYPGVIQAYGLREIINGIGVLGCARPAGWMWARVAGDVLDLATAAAALPGADEGRRKRVLATLVALAGATALDLLTSMQLSAAAALEG